ncbi:Cell division protein FtsL [subsurface metagenome]
MKKGLVLYFFYTLLIVSLVLFYLRQHSQVIEMGYAISDLKNNKLKLEDEKKRLEMERSNFSSLSRVEGIARERGMVFPQEMRVITIKEKKNERSKEMVPGEN